MTTVGRKEFEKKLYARSDLKLKDIQLIMIAYRLAKYGHRNQSRYDGTRYFEHPKRTSLILMDECGIFTPAMLIAALLHDIKEDTFILTWNDIELIFGKKIMGMIEILTKDDELEKTLMDEVYFRALLAAPKKVRIIKLADRLDNVRDLNCCSKEKQEEYIKETVEFYLPLAEKTDKHLYYLIKSECEKYEQG